MADVDFTTFTQIGTPVPTTQLVGYEGTDEKRILISDLHESIQLDTGGGYSYSAGQLHYDAAFKCITADTGFSGVRTAIGQESHTPFFNNTASTILNGTPLAGEGNYTGGIPDAVPADADDAEHVLGFLGIATHDVVAGAAGLATIFGAVQGVNTAALSVNPVYLASGGGLTNTIPTYPTYRLLIGGITVSHSTTGVIGVSPVRIPRTFMSKSYFFTSAGVSAGTFWEAGYYDWSAVDANLTQASLTVTHGTAGEARAAHAGIVPSAAGSVTGVGQVGLRVTGTTDSESGVQVAAQTVVITDDITTLTADVLAETSEKFSGQVSFELYEVINTSLTAYSLDFNYGFSKYEDFAGRKFTLVACEAKWRGAASDTAADVAVMHHKPTGWTYAAAGFEAGSTDIASKLVDQATDGDIADGVDGAWKRVGLNTVINGDASEGLVIRLVTNSAPQNTYQTLDLHLGGFSEEI